MTAPVACHVTRWASDPYSSGSYSFVAVGASGRDYDQLALPIARCVLFAGEHTCKEHPDTVGGAMLTGMREASRAIQLLKGGAAAEEAAALTAARLDSRPDKKRQAEAGDTGVLNASVVCKHALVYSYVSVTLLVTASP